MTAATDWGQSKSWIKAATATRIPPLTNEKTIATATCDAAISQAGIPEAWNRFNTPSSRLLAR